MRALRRLTMVLWLTVLAGGLATAAEAAEPAAPRSAVRQDPLDHIVVIVEQNHTYDSYFGHYPRGRGYGEVEVWPSDASGNPVRPFLWKDDLLEPFQPAPGAEPLSNGAAAARAAIGGGEMTGFVRAQEERGFPGPLAMATHDRSTARPLWELADDYVLFDNYFSTVPGGSLANLLYLYTGQNPGIEEGTKRSLQRLAELAPTTVFDRLSSRDVDWGFYSAHLAQVDRDRLRAGAYFEETERTPSALYWAPFLVSPATWTTHGSRLHTQDDFFSDAARGELPAVSFVLPSPTDHSMNVGSGHERLASLVSAVQKGPGWNRTAVFVLWDDWGGFYDHVKPPEGRGLRVPMLLVSPWAKAGYISSVERDHTSVLDYLLTRNGLEPTRPDDRTSSDFSDAFDFARPRPRTELLAGATLPPPPRGTDRQNRLTLSAYLGMLGVVALGLVPALWWCERRRAPSVAKPAGRTVEAPGPADRSDTASSRSLGPSAWHASPAPAAAGFATPSAPSGLGEHSKVGLT